MELMFLAIDLIAAQAVRKRASSSPVLASCACTVQTRQES
jgi:hypothetical protein